MTFEDASKLIETILSKLIERFETILVISALLLSFSVSALQSLSHDDIFEADKRWIIAIQLRNDPTNDAFIPSVYLLRRRIYRCLGIFSVVLITSAAIYGSLMFSNARNDRLTTTARSQNGTWS